MSAPDRTETTDEPEFYLRLNDPLQPVYQVDRVQDELRMVASRIGTLSDAVWPLKGRDDWPDDKFLRVRRSAETDGVVRYVPYE